jgi:hypothetical protein
VHRDMMGTFKDLAIRRARGLSKEMSPYHSVDCADDPEECFRRRSFAYDFKTGEYIFKEIETLLASFRNVPVERFQEAVRASFRAIVTEDVAAYFGSKSRWWAYANVRPDGGKPYLEMKEPKYR